jgi:hypothetical protein
MARRSKAPAGGAVPKPKPPARSKPRNGGDRTSPAAIDDSAAKKTIVLAQIAEWPNLGLAAQAANVDRRTVWSWRQNDPAFAARYSEAMEIGITALEDEARQRAKTSSDVLLIFMLKAAKPEVYRERFEHQMVGKDGAPLQPVLNLTLNATPTVKGA